MKPAVPEVLPLARALYATKDGFSGCCLHVVLDDCNVETEFVEYALADAIERGHPKCEELARLLLQMSRTQRLKIARGIYG